MAAILGIRRKLLAALHAERAWPALGLLLGSVSGLLSETLGFPFLVLFHVLKGGHGALSH
jgi:hypothetical protein